MLTLNKGHANMFNLLPMWFYDQSSDDDVNPVERAKRTPVKQLQESLPLKQSAKFYAIQLDISRKSSRLERIMK